jgi:signal transduction histidine kinase
VKGHGVQLRQVVLNLVTNACDAMSGIPSGRRKLTVKSRRVTPNEVEVSVSDCGPGFPEEMLQHLFEPFRTTKPDGLGLGLAICQSVIAAHGGELVATNNTAEGATVSFTLPAQDTFAA